MPKASSFELGKTTQTAGTWKTKGKAKGKHIEICEKAATCSVQDLRENIQSEMRAIGKKINFFITGDKFRTFLDMPSFALSWFFDTSGFVEMLWNLNGWIVFRCSRYEKRAGSRSLSHWQARRKEVQVIPQRSIFSLSPSLSQIWSKPLCGHTRNKRELLRNRSRVKTSEPCYVTCYIQRCWQMTVNTWLEKINATNLFSSITLLRNNLFFWNFL